MRFDSLVAAALVWMARPGSALQAMAVVGAAIAGALWLLDRLSGSALFGAILAMGLLWSIGTWLQRH
jgi:hypothetical protein